MRSDLVRILDGNMFVLSEGNGDIEATPRNPCGFFDFDTRFLSRWRLSVNGERLNALGVDQPHYFEVRFFLVPGVPTHYVDAKASVLRERSIAMGAVEERLTVINHDAVPVDFTVRLDADTDFAPVTNVERRRQPVGRLERRVEPGRLVLGYRRERFWRQTVVSVADSAEVDEQGITFRFRVPAGERWTTLVRIGGGVLRPDGQDVRERLYHHRRRSRTELRDDLDGWLERTPRISCDWEVLTDTYRRSLVDLAGLRFSPLTLPDEVMPAAGLPWVATLTGRDSILTSLQVLPVAPEMAVATLRMLGLDQGAVLDDLRDEEPGKILREFRYGEPAAFEEEPDSPYYGSADVTPLYVVLLDEYERWSGDVAVAREFEAEARAALHWIDEYGDIMGDGYVWYQRRNERTGLENQCWKESADAISYRDGRQPGLPRATCELQGYAYDAKRRGARLARECWGDPGYADRLEREAAELKRRFNRDFWVADGGYYALALDADGSQVDALASNIGHLLWSGIVDDDRAESVARHLLGPRLFSGWGVRTLAAGEGRYNPLGYHVGAVWPFDNALIAWGLRRYGFRREAGVIAEAIIDAAGYFEGRLPEAFAGFDRKQTGYPVSYPTANSPQAMATTAPILLLRTLLGLEPQGEHLVVAPALPARFGRIEMLDIPGRWGRIDAIATARY